ncbi:electron transport complex subunit RsxC, partial [Aestuariibacter salexigens]|uniref:electron transport complex subunit RsxC n=1 Tax=Aestuariibacter salexigens TaxID=226010 RepID=UPI0004296A14
MAITPLSVEDIFDRLKRGKRWDFPGGVHPAEHKTLSNQSEIARVKLADKLYIPLKQHIGVEGELQVSVGQKVLKGQPLTHSAHPFAVPVHASTSGTVVDIAPQVAAHPSGLSELSVVIEPDGIDQWIDLKPLSNYQEMDKAQVVEAICDAGISGLGGAGFPSHIKAQPGKNVEFLVINGVECEPYITSDDRLMREHAWQIRQGIDVLVHLLAPRHVIIAVEDNKPEALDALSVACRDASNYLVCDVATKYPAGGEKQLVQVLTGREVPGQGLPIDVGVIMYNVGTCFAIADAIFSGKPLVERVVTLTGGALNKPHNVWAPLGTPVEHLLSVAEYQPGKQASPRVIMGGPMMGFTVTDARVPVVKITNCLLVPSVDEVRNDNAEQPCIRCSACADACPASLLPQQLYWHSKAAELDKAQDYNLFDCIECGACAYVCPSEIPLVQYYRQAKADIRNQRDEKDKAERAKRRFEARKARLEAEQQAREEKHRKAAEARKQAMQNKDTDKSARVSDAIARAKAKKQQTENVTEPVAETQPKNAAVAAAIARAKAKRAAQTDAEKKPEATVQPSPAHNHESDNDDAESAAQRKQRQIAAAVARAKAKKQQGQDVNKTTPAQHKSDEAGNNEQQSEQDIQRQAESKQQRIAAAVARAKAKKANRQQAQNTSDSDDVTEEKNSQS